MEFQEIFKEFKTAMKEVVVKSNEDEIAFKKIKNEYEAAKTDEERKQIVEKWHATK
jgi:formiminotetrahydrofolate cyclodeaminase